MPLLAFSTFEKALTNYLFIYVMHLTQIYMKLKVGT